MIGDVGNEINGDIGRTHRTDAYTSGATAMNLEWIELMPADVEVLPKYRKRVMDRQSKGLCINIIELSDGTKQECNSPSRTRGLCNNCHYAFRMERKDTAKTKRRLYENNRIRIGTLMPDRQGQRVKRTQQRKAG